MSSTASTTESGATVRAGDHPVHAAWATVRAAAARFFGDQGMSWAGAIGLYIFLSVPPFIVASVYLAGLVVSPGEAERFVLEQVGRYLPAQQQLLEGIVEQRPSGPLAGAVSIVLLLFSGSRAFAAMTAAFNGIWDREDGLTFWRKQGLRLGMLAVALVLLIGTALIQGAIAAVVSTGAVDGGSGSEFWLLELQVLPIAQLVLFLLIAYRFLPLADVSWSTAAVGAVLAAIGVRIAQAVTAFLAEAGALETSYGAYAGIALLAVWALVVGAIVLFGAALVAVLGGHVPETDGSTLKVG